MSGKTNALISQILEGADPREVISTAVSDSVDHSEAVTPTDEVATVTKKVVRGGKVVKKKFKKYKKRRILNAAQKKAIKKAQIASKKSSARIKLKKSLKKAAAIEGVIMDEELEILCPDDPNCTLELRTDIDDATVFTCPETGEDYILVAVSALADLIPEDLGEDEDVDIDIAEDDEVVDAEDEAEGEGTEEPVADGVAEEGTEEPVAAEPVAEECGSEEEDEDEPLYFEDED